MSFNVLKQKKANSVETDKLGLLSFLRNCSFSVYKVCLQPMPFITQVFLHFSFYKREMLPP